MNDLMLAISFLFQAFNISFSTMTGRAGIFSCHKKIAPVTDIDRLLQEFGKVVVQGVG
jgi:hypothetical protein